MGCSKCMVCCIGRLVGSAAHNIQHCVCSLRACGQAVMFQTACVMLWFLSAGAKVTEETSWLAGLVMNVVFLLGLFT